MKSLSMRDLGDKIDEALGRSKGDFNALCYSPIADAVMRPDDPPGWRVTHMSFYVDDLKKAGYNNLADELDRRLKEQVRPGTDRII